MVNSAVDSQTAVDVDDDFYIPSAWRLTPGDVHLGPGYHGVVAEVHQGGTAISLSLYYFLDWLSLLVLSYLWWDVNINDRYKDSGDDSSDGGLVVCRGGMSCCVGVG